MGKGKPSLFVKRDIDGFFGLFIDNLVQLLVIAELTVNVAGLTREFVYSRILPGAAISVLIGNLFYGLQAYLVARREGRNDVTALPYGINTPSVFAYIFFVMGPVFGANKETMGVEGAANLAWLVGLAACLGSGLIEFFGAFVAGPIRRATPRAALLSALAGIAIGFISMDFILRVFNSPMLAMIPMGILIIQYFSGVRLPWGMPAGFVALVVGTGLGWIIKGVTISSLFGDFPISIQEQLKMEVAGFPTKDQFFAAFQPVLSLPKPNHLELWEFLKGNWPLVQQYLSVIIPMGLFNLIGSLQNIESAEAAGDKFRAAPSLAINGIGTISAAMLGSCFPTTIYIGHVGWKHLGARSGYSILNGVAICAICLLGLVQSIGAVVPVAAVSGILVWIAVIIGAQAFQAVPKRHAPAVALGLIPGIAAWGLLVSKTSLAAIKHFDIGAEDIRAPLLADVSLRLGGLVALERGFIITSMGLAAIGAYVIDKKFKPAAFWAWTLAGLCLLGITHAWDPLAPGAPYSNGLMTGWRYAFAYAVIGWILFALRNRPMTGGEHQMEEELIEANVPAASTVMTSPPSATPEVKDPLEDTAKELVFIEPADPPERVLDIPREYNEVDSPTNGESTDV